MLCHTHAASFSAQHTLSSLNLSPLHHPLQGLLRSGDSFYQPPQHQGIKWDQPELQLHAGSSTQAAAAASTQLPPPPLPHPTASRPARPSSPMAHLCGGALSAGSRAVDIVQVGAEAGIQVLLPCVRACLPAHWSMLHPA